MSDLNERILTIVTNDVKERVCDMKVVTPEIYAGVFTEVAKSHDIDYGDMVKGYIDKEIERYLQLQNQTTINADKLSQNTSKAIDAIEQKDTKSLQEVHSETEKLKQELQRLKESLYSDELTNAFNRKWLFDTLTDQDRNLIHEGVVGLIDLNYFKQINDTYGHIIGDKVLVFIVAQLKKSRGKVVRYGGDEFLVFFQSQTDSEAMKGVLVGIREEILKKHLKAKDHEFRVSFSIGMASYLPGEKLDLVIERADSDMYADKEEIKQRIKGIDI